MDKKVIEHFTKHDPVLASYIEKVELVFTDHSDNLFKAICSEIISQQLSGRVADVIFGRFEKLFSDGDITAEKLLKLPDETLRGVGTSWAKVRSLKDLAQKVVEKKLHLDKLDAMPDEEVMKELTSVKGIGPWTAEMFLMFTLGREDIFSHGDLGLKRAIQKMYGFKKEPTIQQVEKIIKKWSPYKSYASRILWKSLEIKEE